MAHTKYTAELAEEICERIAIGESLRTICKDEHIVAAKTVDHWLSEREDFRKQYARARERQAEHYAQEIIDIADTDPDAARARNRIAARQWYASKLKPKVYGDKVLHTGDDDSPVLVRIERVIVDDRPRIEGEAVEVKPDKLTH